MFNRIIVKVIFKLSVIRKYLILFKIKKYLSIQGWLTSEEAFGLYTVSRLISKESKPIVLEIGSWKGKSTFCIAMGLRNGIINCIDPFNAIGEPGSQQIYLQKRGDLSLLEQFRQNLNSIPKGVQLNILKGLSKEFVGSISEIDFLFIDGDHSIEGCQFDFIKFSCHVKSGGYLAFHDYDPNRKDLGPTWVIENILNQQNLYTHYKNFDSLCVFKKY